MDEVNKIAMTIRLKIVDNRGFNRDLISVSSLENVYYSLLDSKLFTY